MAALSYLPDTADRAWIHKTDTAFLKGDLGGGGVLEENDSKDEPHSLFTIINKPCKLSQAPNMLRWVQSSVH